MAGAADLRPLLPRRSEVALYPASSCTTETIGPARKAPVTSAPSILGKSRVGTACKPCRKRRSKCNGARPVCLRCRQMGIDCEYEIPAMESMKRKLDQLEESHERLADSEARLKRLNSVYTDLVHILRTRPPGEVGAVVSRMRSGDDVESVVRLAKDGDLLQQLALAPTKVQFRYEFPLLPNMPSFLLEVKDNVYLSSTLFSQTVGLAGNGSLAPAHAPSAAKDQQQQNRTAGGTTTAVQETACIYEIPFHAATLVEPRLGKVKASQWTSVQCSDSLFRNLIELYFVHEFPSCCVFHKDYFLDDLVSGRDRYCSPLLVNAILALACHGNKKSDLLGHFWNPKNHYYKFLAEFKRLWQLETHKRRITTVQASVIACVSHNLDGSDKVGSSFLAQGLAIAYDMGLFKDETYKNLGRKRRAVYSVTAQGIFSWESIESFCLFREPYIHVHPPPFPPPGEAHHSTYAGELLLQYPGTSGPIPMHHGQTFRAQVEFRVIMSDIAHRVYGEAKKGPLTMPEAMRLRRRLMAWYDELPPALTAAKIVTPTDLKLHMHYHNLMAMLFDSPVAMALDGMLASDGGGADGPQPTPGSIISYSKTCFETVFRLYYLRHGTDGWDSTMVHYNMVASFSALARYRCLASMVTPEDDKERQAALSSVLLGAKGLRDHGRYSYLSEVIFRLLKQSVPEQGLNYLDQLGTDLPAAEEEEREEITSRLRSTYPVNVASIADNPATHRLDAFIRSYSKLGIDCASNDLPDATEM